MSIKKVFLFFASMFIVCFLNAQTLTIGTYNLRFDNPEDTGNLWKDRAPIVAEVIRFHDFDIFGTQEGLKNQLDDINKALPQYSRYGLGRDDGKDKGEHSAIFYKKDKFKLLDNGDFWLSQTPGKPSLGWDATCCNRICSWIHLQDKKSGKKFYFFNAHYDHQGVVARIESSKLILKKIRAIAKSQPVIFTGDLNGDHASDWYKTIATSGVLNDSYNGVKHPYVVSASFNAFGKAKGDSEVIDHIFVSRQFKVRKWGVLTDTYRGKYPSDHFPVLAELVLK